MSVYYSGANYYVTNIQGDVIAILNSSGTTVAEYVYDAWGNLISTTGSMATTLGVQNPLRYRGYVYDQEYGLYYLQSRYYNPETGRFINADALASTGQGILGNNMFAYCNNNSVIFKDSDGLCREVGALLTWIDCKSVFCPTSKSYRPHFSQNNTSNGAPTDDICGTASVGISLNLSLGFWSFSGRVSVNTDLAGKSALQLSYGAGLSTEVGASLLIDMAFSNAPSVDNLLGMGYTVGVDMGCAAAGYNIIPDKEKNTIYHGVSFAGGISTPGSIGPSVAMSNTTKSTEIDFNLLEFSESVYNSMWGIY